MSTTAAASGGASGSATGDLVSIRDVAAGRFLAQVGAADTVTRADVVALAVAKVVADDVSLADAVTRTVNSSPSLSDGAGPTDVVALTVAVAKSDPVSNVDSGSAYFDNYSIDYSPGYAGTTAAW